MGSGSDAGSSHLHLVDGAPPANLWAPDVIEHEGHIYLFYSASSLGANRSVIGLAAKLTLHPEDPDYRSVDRGARHRVTPRKRLGCRR
jgi:arabinan endo-1,5-alpha-L-arabinosidase